VVRYGLGLRWGRVDWKVHFILKITYIKQMVSIVVMASSQARSLSRLQQRSSSNRCQNFAGNHYNVELIERHQ